MKSWNYIQILEEYLLLYRVICFPNGGEIFQEDNAPCHQSRSTMAFLEEHNINTVPWPPYSPDLNIITQSEKLVFFSFMKTLDHCRPVKDNLWV
jgi:transposase